MLGNKIQIKKLKHLDMFYDETFHEILIRKDGISFAISKNEIFPVLRGLVSATQRFYRRKNGKK